MAGSFLINFRDEGRSRGRHGLPRYGNIVLSSRIRLSHGIYLVFLSVVSAILLSISVPTLQAGMYVCTDRSGAVFFSNVPNGPTCKSFTLQKGLGRLTGLATSTGSARYDREIRKIARRYKVDPSLIKAIIHTESDFNHRAVSKCGAKGLMQLMPETARQLRVSNPFNASENIDGGTRYFRSLMDSFNEDLTLSLAAYNAGPGLVSRTGGVPNIPETQRYIKKVLNYYKRYKATM